MPHTIEIAHEPLPIVIIDDDAVHRDLLERLIKAHAGTIRAAGVLIYKFADAVHALAALPPGDSVVVCDYMLADSCAFDWMPEFAKAGSPPIILMTSSGNEGVACQAFRAGLSDYLVKSEVFNNPAMLADSIRKASRRHRLEKTNRELAKQLKTLNSELQVRNEALAALSDTAHRFVDDVAHEFRTPLAVIREFASIISDGIGGPVSERQQEFLKHINQASLDLTTLVDDFLDTSRLRARSLRVDRAPHTAAELFESVRALLQQRANSKRIRITDRVEEGTAEMFVDLEKARRIVMNLVVNAIKFAPPDSEVSLVAASRVPGDIEVSVADRGPGLSESQLSQLFQRFSRASDESRSNIKGFGLGLSISLDLARLSLGRMNVASELGKGSTFTLSVPSNDIEAILAHFVEVVLKANPDSAVSLLRADLPQGGGDLEAIRQRLVNICYPFDVAVKNRECDALWIFGITDQPAKWIARLQSVLAASSSESAPLLSVAGCWSGAQAQDQIRQRVSATHALAGPSAQGAKQ